MSNSDPTDHALAAIASMLEQPPADRNSEKVVVEEKPAIPETVEGDGYSKIGPGPIAAIRFRWTARLDDKGDYYVHETVGENSQPMTAGPMTKDAAIRFVDEREVEARRRFEQLKAEMIGQRVRA